MEGSVGGGAGGGRRGFSDGDNGVESEGHREDAVAFVVYMLANKIDSAGSSGEKIGWSAKLGLESLSDCVVSSLGIFKACDKSVGVVNCFGFNGLIMRIDVCFLPSLPYTGSSES